MKIVKAISTSRKEHPNKKTAKEHCQTPTLHASKRDISTQPLSLTSVDQQITNFNWH